jgi:virginiamycin B lyase
MPEMQNGSIAMNRAGLFHSSVRSWAPGCSALGLILMALRAGTILYLIGSLGTPAHSRQASLPDGEGKQLVENLCTSCHRIDQITRSSGYTMDGWKELTSAMLDLSANPHDQTTITGYLARHFPPNNERAPRLVPGDTRIRFEEWKVPTLGQRARDPVQAGDGTIWWAGQWGNLIGRLDPESGAMQEYPLPPGSMPHSITVDGQDRIWYTGNKNATIGRLDPKSEEIRVYEMPDPNARDPHTAIFDDNGILWFTLQHSNQVGRLDPASGGIDLVTLKTPGSKPYGIKIDAHNVPWVACNGSNCLVKVDPLSMQLTEIELPDPATRVRRLDIAPDGMIWFVNSSKGRLGRYDPQSGAVKEWPSPSGPASHPYAMAIVDGIIWYNESGKRPDALVRFDPATQTFQSWPIPSGGIHAGIVRHMRATREGDLLIHQGSTNRILRVSIPKPAGTQ